MQNISRRSFVETAGIAGAAVAASGAMAATAQADEAVEGKTWRDAPAVPADDQVSEAVDADVVVVGAGDAGLVAATSAIQNGVKNVLVLEKMEYSRVGGGVHGILGSQWSDEIGITWAPEEIDAMIKDEMIASCMRADERYYRVWANRSREVFEHICECFDTQYVHLVNNGKAPYDQKADEYFSESVYPGQGLQVSSGDVNTPLIDGLTAWIQEQGGEIRYNTKGEQLIMEDGKVAGLYALKEDGSYLKVNTTAVILAGGSIEGNDEMFKEFCPQVYPIDCSNYAPGDGSAIQMAVWAGGQMQNAPICTMANTAISPDAPNVPSPIPFIVVNRNGERFMNEATSSFCVPMAIINQPGKVAVPTTLRLSTSLPCRLGWAPTCTTTTRSSCSRRLPPRVIPFLSSPRLWASTPMACRPPLTTTSLWPRLATMTSLACPSASSPSLLPPRVLTGAWRCPTSWTLPAAA